MKHGSFKCNEPWDGRVGTSCDLEYEHFTYKTHLHVSHIT